jgi:hypothetical protein
MRPGLDLLSRPEPRLTPSEAAPLAPVGHIPEKRQTGHVLAYGRGKVAPAGRVGREGDLVSGQPLRLLRKLPGIGERERLVRWAKLLAWLGVGWHGVEAAIAVGAGVVAGSIALVGFGADSLIESLAGIILLWRFAAARLIGECGAERPEAHRRKFLPHSGLRRLRGSEESTLRRAA